MDTLSNLLTSIRNAELAQHAHLRVPYSKHSLDVLGVLKLKGYVQNFEEVAEEKKKFIEINLPTPITIHHYKRISKPGRRLYTESAKIPIVLRGLGMVIVSTSQGVMSGKDAHKKNLGGELLCEVY